MKRKTSTAGLQLVLILAVLWGCSRPAPSAHKLIVLGIDGMDPQLLGRYIGQGSMPNFARLAAMGAFREIATTTPAQSPVAWSSLITGLDPGGHGIFDFIHRDPATLSPYLSTSSVEAPKYVLPVGGWRFPLSSGKAILLRHGKAFWQILDEHRVSATIFRIPANFPPALSKARTLAGMGTPDLLGGYGTFSFYTDNPFTQTGAVNGGRVYRVAVEAGQARAKLEGPANSFREGEPSTAIDFSIQVDPDQPVVRIDIQNRSFVLRQGEWSDWIPVQFDMMPYLGRVAGICRFYLKQAHPSLQLYVSPINLDPSQPALPLSTPKSYSRELWERTGYFYTQGIAEDTKALSSGILNEQEYLEQARTVFDEQQRFLDLELGRFRSGVLFFYLSSLDQNGHIFFDDKPGGGDGVLRDFYERTDRLLGRVMEKLAGATLIVVSDHGFAPFRRSFNLNGWLLENGYLSVPASAPPGSEFPANIDWSTTRVYGLGLNGLYLNLRGREQHGNVQPGAEAQHLLAELRARLLSVKDADSSAVITRVDAASEIYTGTATDRRPDLLIGYNRGYRAGWSTVLGGISGPVLEDNNDEWKADHCIDPSLVPGVLLSNKQLLPGSRGLTDIAPTILAEFGIPKPKEMKGSPVFGVTSAR